MALYEARDVTYGRKRTGGSENQKTILWRFRRNIGIGIGLNAGLVIH